jgi:hypothetical protein
LLTANLLLHLNTFVATFRVSTKSPLPVAWGKALYPRKMPSDPAQPPSPEPPRSGGADDRTSTASGEQERIEPGSEQRYGPLRITRVVKDDGRSLILYGHDESRAELAQAELEKTTAREPEHGDSPA